MGTGPDRKGAVNTGQGSKGPTKRNTGAAKSGPGIVKPTTRPPIRRAPLLHPPPACPPRHSKLASAKALAGAALVRAGGARFLPAWVPRVESYLVMECNSGRVSGAGDTAGGTNRKSPASHTP